MSEEQTVLSLHQVNIDFGPVENPFHAVKNLSFSVKRGQTVAIVGESGSGKSVSSMAIMRLIEFAGGRIPQGEIMFTRRDGQTLDLRQASEKTMQHIRGSDLGMIFQEPMTSLNPSMTIANQLTEGIKKHLKQSSSQAKQTAINILKQVRIPAAESIMKRYPHQLSGGMRQRVMIAMALVCKPTLLIADEPTTALDVTIQAQTLSLIKELQQEMNMGVIFITHDMGVVAEIADHVVVMCKGEVVEQNEVNALFKNPQHPYTKALMAAVPKLGEMKGTTLPARFNLIQEDGSNKPTTPEKSSVAPSNSVILQAKEIVTRFPVHKGYSFRATHQVHAVERVSFSLHAGETLSLVGESGCGKTTTGRALLNIAPLTSGQVFFEGQQVDPNDKKSIQHLQKNIQVVFQDPFSSLNPRMRIGDSIKEPLTNYGILSGDAAKHRVAELLERVGLEASMAHRWPHEFSGGQRQRICIARALAVNPKVLIGDESVSALDVSVQAQIINLMIDLQKELGISYLFISHDMAVVERISHRVAVMYLGQIVEIGSRQAIFENPQHAYTKKLLSAVPIPDPQQRHKHTLAVSDIPSPIRAVGDNPIVKPLVEVEPGHFVAKHPIGGDY